MISTESIFIYFFFFLIYFLSFYRPRHRERRENNTNTWVRWVGRTMMRRRVRWLRKSGREKKIRSSDNYARRCPRVKVKRRRGGGGGGGGGFLFAFPLALSSSLINFPFPGTISGCGGDAGVPCRILQRKRNRNGTERKGEGNGNWEWEREKERKREKKKKRSSLVGAFPVIVTSKSFPPCTYLTFSSFRSSLLPPPLSSCTISITVYIFPFLIFSFLSRNHLFTNV